MGFWSRLIGGSRTDAAAPSAAVQERGGGVLVTTSDDLERVMRGETVSVSGQAVNAESAMRVAAVYACVRLRAGTVATLPLQVKRRIDDRTRENASDLPIWNVLRRRPNAWQTPSQFRRMMTAHQLLRGNSYAMIVRLRGQVRELIPLHPDRIEVLQSPEDGIAYIYTAKNGGRTMLPAADVFHLVGLTLDGFRGVSPITYARETIGMSLAMEQQGATAFKYGPRASMVLTHPGKLGPEGRANIKASLDEYRTGGENEGRALVLEEAMKIEPLAITAEDAQWIEARKFSRTDIAMFFGVPPHMIGDTEKSTSWGTGLEQQTQGFVTFVLEEDLTMWEEAINRDLLPANDPDIYARFNRAALVRGDLKARWESYVKALQWGVLSPNEVRALEDQNPRDGGDVYYPPPNTAGGQTDDNSETARNQGV